MMLMFFIPKTVLASTTVKINDLKEKAQTLDGQSVTIVAEAIGEKMARSGGTWINVNDCTNAIGVWMTSAEAEKVTSYGNYEQKGDTLEITGIYRRACKEHGGEPDIHLTSMKIAAKGHAVEEDVSLVKIALSVIFGGMCLLLLLFYRKQTKYINKISTKNGRRNGHTIDQDE